jgi:demethylmenaquinone methyltransferase/2-methoxy-6-polyprenyl-1,4-benzoquinol methylase
MVTSDKPTTPKKPLHTMFTAIPQHYDLINSIITWGMDKGWRARAEEGVTIKGTDYSEPMLEIAKEKTALLSRNNNIIFTSADASELPFPDMHFDCVCISFAFRNLTYNNPHADSHLSEVLRVLKPEGRFIIVESSQPDSKLLRGLYHLYMRWFVYRIGSMLSGNKQAYHYLAESAARFYTSNEVADMLITTGFRQVSFKPLFLGVAGIHIAVR